MVETKNEVKKVPELPKHWVLVPKDEVKDQMDKYGKFAFNVGFDGNIYRSDYEHPSYKTWFADKTAKKDAKLKKKADAKEHRRKVHEDRVKDSYDSGYRSGYSEAKKKYLGELTIFKADTRYKLTLLRINGNSKKGTARVTDSSPVTEAPPVVAPVAVTAKK